MLGDSLSFPTNNEDWLKTHIIGGALFLFSFLLIPILPVYGYTVEVIRRSARGNETAPTFDDWETLFIDGLKVFVIQFVYSIPVMIAYFAFLFLGFFSFALGAEGGDAGAAAGGLMFMVLFGVFGLVALFVGYITPAAVSNFAVYDDLGKAFSIREILGVAFTADYFIAMILVMIVGGILMTIAALLSLIVIGLPLLFFVQVFIYSMYGRAYAKGRQKRGNPVA